MKKLIFYVLLILFLFSSINVVCSANVTDDSISNIDESIDLSNVNDETHLSNDLQNNNVLNDDSDNDNVLNHDDSSQVLSEVHVPEPDFNSSEIIVQKSWEGNYSGNISYIEIQLLKKVYTPPIWKSTPQDPIFNDTVGNIVILEKNGNYIPYVIVAIEKIYKDNDWKHVFSNISFSYYIQEYLEDGTYRYTFDETEYIIREVNVPNNVEIVNEFYYNYTNFNNSFQLYWNLTNKVIREHNTTHEVVTHPENSTEILQANSTSNNSTTEVNEESQESDEDDDTSVNKTSSTYEPDSTTTNNTTNNSTDSESQIINTESATGNPIFVLLMVILVSFIPIFRKK